MENEINNPVAEPIEGQSAQEPKTYTQEEVDSLLQKVGVNYPPMHPNCRCTVVPAL